MPETVLFDQSENDSDKSLGYEVYMSEGDAVESDGLIWKEILREGTWSYRPGPGHKPLAKPLTIVAGNSSNEDEIGMADIVEAFEDGAIDHVTIPTSHDDKPHENTGYIRKLEQGIRNGRQVLIAGLDFTEPEIKEKAVRGSIANTSAGIIAGYINKFTGKTYKYALGHVALTNKPWINGMTPFGANSNFSEDNIIPVAISLDMHKGDNDMEESEEGKAAQFLDSLLKAFKSRDTEALASLFEEFNGAWPSDWNESISDMIYEGREDEPAMLREIVGVLRESNQTFNKDFFEKLLQESNFSEESFGESSINESHENEEEEASAETSEDEGADSGASKDDEDNKGGNDMSESSTESVESDKTELSEDTTTADLLAEHKVELSEQLAARDAEIEKLRSEVHANKVDNSIEELKALGFSEFPGFLKTVRDIYLADAKEASVITLSEDDGSTTELTASEIVNKLIQSLPTEELFKHSFSDNLTSMDDHSRPGVSLSDTERGAKLAEHLGIDLPKDGDN